MQGLIIHEFDESFLKIDVSSYDVITYDDSLESQLYYRDKFPRSKQIFFITPAFIIRGENDQGQKCMTLDDVKMLHKEGFQIGAHSYSHTPLGYFEDLAAQTTYLMHDTEICAKWFKRELGFQPKAFAFPYNDDCKGVYRAIAKKFGFTELYGEERKPIERLLRN